MKAEWLEQDGMRIWHLPYNSQTDSYVAYIRVTFDGAELKMSMARIMARLELLPNFIARSIASIFMLEMIDEEPEYVNDVD